MESNRGMKHKAGGRGSLTGILRMVSAFLFTLLPLMQAYSFSTTNIWMEDAFYADVEWWAVEGLVESQILSTKPMTRSEAGKQILVALQKCAMGQESPVCANIQNHYKNLFEPEIAEAKNNDGAGSFVKPMENLSLSFRYLDGPFSVFNTEGIPHNTGSNFILRMQSGARLWQVFSFYLEPAFVYNNHDGDEFYPSETEVRLHRGYGKINIMNFEIQAGRDSLWWGPGYHGALLMSNNAKPLDMIKLSNPEPVLLPWIFSYLGPAQFHLIFSQLHDVRKGTFKVNPFLYGLRINIKPHPYLELGASQLNMFGGAGRRDLDIGDVAKILYGNINPKPDSKIESNSQMAVDFALTLPHIGKYIMLTEDLKIYAEWGAEDSGLPPDKRAFLCGVAFFKPFGLEGTTLRFEYTDTSPRSMPGAWYVHASYPMIYDNRLIGHHVGTDAEDFFMQWSQDFGKIFYKLNYDRERSGLHTQQCVQSKNQYGGELGMRLGDHAGVTLQYVFEEIKNLGYLQDQTQKNHFLGVTTTFFF